MVENKLLNKLEVSNLQLGKLQVDNLRVTKLLNEVNSPEDLKKLDIDQLEVLSEEIREFLIEVISKNGGHLASNLGVVELTLALHMVFDTLKDKLIWDVGHQSYVHKIITGRRDQFDRLRKKDGLSGFPKVNESPHDVFNTGHSSTSISAGLGFAKARDIKNENHSVISVIGDGALTGGMAFEALNDAGRSPNNFIVVLNDNEMSISKNVGGLSSYLSKIRTEPIYYKVKEDIDLLLKKIPAIGKSAIKAIDAVKGSIKYMITPGMIFEELGFKYIGPIDGHNLSELIDVFKRAKAAKGPVLVHVMTQKGKGYHHAEKMPQLFHGISPFEIETGEVVATSCTSYSDVFGRELVKIAEKQKEVVAITAAMPHGTGLEVFSKYLNNRFFDVGIAEQHAVTFAAGLSRGGLVPVVAIYSSFLQRAYDQILHDVAVQNLHVVFAIDRAGIVGEDGETHQGIYDLSFLSHIPNMTIIAPSDYTEFVAMLDYAVLNHKGPIAIRYPRGKGVEKLFECGKVECGKALKISEGTDVSIVAIGNMVEIAMKAATILSNNGISVDLINSRFVKPLDEKMIIDSASKTKVLVTIEDNTILGGFGSSVLEVLNKNNINTKTKVFAFPDLFIEHGSKLELMQKYGLTPEAISESIIRKLKN